MNNNQQNFGERNQYQQKQKFLPQQNSWQFPVLQQKQQNYKIYQQPFLLNNQKGLIRLSSGDTGSNEKREAIVTELNPSTLDAISGRRSILV